MRCGGYGRSAGSLWEHFRQPSPTTRAPGTRAPLLLNSRLAARPRRSGLAHRSRLCSPREASLCASVHASLLGTSPAAADIPLLPPLPPPDALALAASPRSGGLAQRSALGTAPRSVGGLTALVVIAVILVGGGGVGCHCAETPRCATIRSGLLVGLDAVGGGAAGTLSCTGLRLRFPALLGLCCCCCCRRRSGH